MVMENPELSRRLADAVNFGDPSPQMRRRIEDAALQATRFEDLPADVRQFITDSER